MTALVWDKAGERTYQGGVDRGVLYLHDGTVVVWNGLTSVEESTPSEIKSFYLDGVKYLDNLILGTFSARLQAFTYPDEFDLVNGHGQLIEGFEVSDQPSESFDLSYRTKVGNDLEGLEHGYKIHILYNVIAQADNASFNTESDSLEPVPFSWILNGTPEKVLNFKPTAHMIIDSRKVSSQVLEILEEQLYGTSEHNPSLPTPSDIIEYFSNIHRLVIIDQGDGSWTAVDPSDEYITMVDSETFVIDNADATYLDMDTYTISTTTPS